MNAGAHETDIIHSTSEHVHSENTHFESILRNARIVLWSVCAPEWKVTYCSQSVQELYGVSVEQFLQQWDWEKYVYAADQALFADAFHSVMLGKSMHLEYRVCGIDGEIYWVESTMIPGPGSGSFGSVTTVDGITMDITQRKANEVKIKEQRRRFEALVEVIPDAVVVHRDGVVEYANHSALRSMGLRDGQGFSGLSIFDFIASTDLVQPQLSYQEVMNNGRVGATLPSVEQTFTRVDGSTFVGEARSVLVEESDGVAILSVVRDITDKKELVRQLEHMAYHDYLTDLPNRRRFIECFSRAIEDPDFSQSTHGVLLLDVDRFKNINDSYGHELGDQVLIQLARRLASILGENHVIARVGGDEFCILCRDASRDEVLQVANEIIRGLEEPINIDTMAFRVVPSIGMGMYPTCGSDVTTLLKHADVAMYLAKSRGGSQTVEYQQGQECPSLRRLNLETALKQALVNNEFHLEYQPKVTSDEGVMVSAEALIRWKRPTGEVVRPDQFIPVAEETGLIRPIGEWVLMEAARQNKEWQKAGYKPIVVSVNVSPKQFASQDVYGLVKKVLEVTRLAPEWLAIEITEGVLMEDQQDVLQIIEQIRNLGVKIAIDDFGKGYSSLRYLRIIKATHMKIDKSFIQMMLEEDESMAIVSSVIQLGHRLGMTVVAEGVETKEQLERLRIEGCDLIQGFYMSRPQSPAIIERHWLASRC